MFFKKKLMVSSSWLDYQMILKILVVCYTIAVVLVIDSLNLRDQWNQNMHVVNRWEKSHKSPFFKAINNSVIMMIHNYWASWLTKTVV